MNKQTRITTNDNENIIVPEYIQKSDVIKIPKKLHKSIDYIPDKYLKKIHKTKSVAKELCLYFTSLLARTSFDTDYNGIRLSSEVLSHTFKPKSYGRHTVDTTTYTNIIKALEIGTPDKGPIIVVSKSYMPGVNSKSYNLTFTYKLGLQNYRLKTKYVNDIKHRNWITLIAKATVHPIANNLLHFYSEIELPTSEELLEIGMKLVKHKYITKKGKILTRQYRQPKSHWKDSDNRSFIEQDIKIFEYYTGGGFMIPIVGGDHCPRVYDSLSLLPSWIRNEIKVNGKCLQTFDYSCLHPNLIQTIYKGYDKFITHDKVSYSLGIDIKKVKILHLSFFNMEIAHLKSSPLFKYYDGPILDKVIYDKFSNNHKITSKLLFTFEVEIMEEVIRRLNLMDIYIGYCYDALFSNIKHHDTIIAVMNTVVSEFKVYTEATLDK